MRDLHNSIRFQRGISAISGAADNVAQVSQIIDRAGYESLEFVISTGTLVDADATFTVLVEDSVNADFTSQTTVAAADLLGTVGNAGFQFDDDNEIRKIGYRGSKRYVRLTITPATNTGAWPICAVAVLGNPRHSPNQNAAGADVTQAP